LRYHRHKSIIFFYFLILQQLCSPKNNLYMASTVSIESSWHHRLAGEFDQPYFQKLTAFVRNEYQTATIYPPGPEIFRAFDCCPFESVKVVLLGQDPYHGPGQANGLCFSVRQGVRFPPSLNNIFTEMQSDLGRPFPASGDLEPWARQGVLLLNATLTVRAGAPGSHQNRGWELFTDAVIKIISRDLKHVVFLLWGAYAQRKGEIIDKQRHEVLQAPHPSPFSADRGFFGCRHFSKTNAYLASKGLTPINW
jgi:uracil-DNA glycosylase